MFVTAGQTGHRKPMDINIFSSSYLQRGNCAKQRAGRRRGEWRLKERIARSHLNNKWGEMSHFHFISTLNIFVSDCNGDGCEWWPARNVELSYICWIQKVSLQSASIEVLLIWSETSRWRQKVGYWMTLHCNNVSWSPPRVFCIALSIVCLHWMDLCTLVKVTYII